MKALVRKRKAEGWAVDLPEEAASELRPEASIRRVPRRAGESGSKCPEQQLQRPGGGAEVRLHDRSQGRGTRDDLSRGCGVVRAQCNLYKLPGPPWGYTEEEAQAEGQMEAGGS